MFLKKMYIMLKQKILKDLTTNTTLNAKMRLKVKYLILLT